MHAREVFLIDGNKCLLDNYREKRSIVKVEWRVTFLRGGRKRQEMQRDTIFMVKEILDAR